MLRISFVCIGLRVSKMKGAQQQDLCWLPLSAQKYSVAFQRVQFRPVNFLRSTNKVDGAAKKYQIFFHTENFFKPAFFYGTGKQKSANAISFSANQHCRN